MTEHLPECPKSGCEACYKQGQRDALDAAVQRVEEYVYIRTIRGVPLSDLVPKTTVIALIKGDQP
jgi:hypothetical protein